MRLAYLGAVLAGMMSSVLVVTQIQADSAPAQPQPAIAPLIAGDYLVAAPGRVEPASEEVRLAASVNGLLSEVLVKPGDHVRRGDVVARLESAAYRAQLEKAQAELRLQEAQLQRLLNGARMEERRDARAAVMAARAVEENASAERERRRKLSTQGVVSQSALDQAEREYAVAHQNRKSAEERYALINEPARDEDVAMAQARIAAARAACDAAQAELDKTVIRSPIDGTVLRTYRHPGELLSVFVDQPILTVGDLSHLYVRAEIDEADVAKVRPGLPAYVTAQAYGSRRFSGHVLRVGQTLGRKKIRTGEPKERADSNVLEVLIALDMPNPLRPGLRVNSFITRPMVSGDDRTAG